MGTWKKCRNCENEAVGDMIYKCTDCNLVFCEECGDFTLNIHGNNNCICPECHSVSNVDILGEIESDGDDDDD